jgi:hypothetical protein
MFEDWGWPFARAQPSIGCNLSSAQYAVFAHTAAKTSLTTLTILVLSLICSLFMHHNPLNVMNKFELLLMFEFVVLGLDKISMVCKRG